MSLAAARIVLVLPVPGGPYKSVWGSLSFFINLLSTPTISLWATNSSSDAGRYFSTHGLAASVLACFCFFVNGALGGASGTGAPATTVGGWGGASTSMASAMMFLC